MKEKLSRRDFLKLGGVAGVVFSTGLFRSASALASGYGDEFYFVQFSDTHWGFNKKKINPDPLGTLNHAIKTVNKLSEKPDFVIFTGDLTHTTDDVQLRRKRMSEFKRLASQLEVEKVIFIPGEHDAALDNGTIYKEYFGETHYTFVHKGVRFIALDNVSDPRGKIGAGQIKWLEETLKSLDPQQPIVVFAHRPLFPLYPQWDWATADGEEVIKRLMPYQNVTVFYGHIHQEHHHMTGHIAHHSAKSLIFPLPVAGSTAKRKPLPWDTAHPRRGLGVRDVEVDGKRVSIKELEIG